MEGVHDIGGLQGFGTVKYPTAPHPETWEPRVRAMLGLGVTHGLFNMDEFRHAVERMHPLHYLTAPYYERHLTAIATLFVEKGLVEKQALAEMAGGDFPLAGALGPGRLASTDTIDFKVGDRVRVKNEYVSGHHRMPGYIRGKEGIIASLGPMTHYPDAAGHNLQAAMEMTYDVRFHSRHLWGDDCDDGYNYVGVFQSYLEPA